MKDTRIAAIAGLLLAAGAINTQGAVIVTAFELGGDVVITLEGSLDLSAWEPSVSGNSIGRIDPAGAQFGLGPHVTDGILDRYLSPPLFDGPTQFGTGDFILTSLGQGDSVSFDGKAAGILVVPSGYVSGSPLSSTSRIDGETLSSVGMIPDTYTWTWGSGASADSLTVNIIPEPSTAFLSLTACAVIGLQRRRS